MQIGYITLGLVRVEMKKRVKKIRGTRTCGGGSHKKRRGKGSKGGSGNAGAYAHHFVRSLKQGMKKGKQGSGSARHSNSKTYDAIMNVGELAEKLEELIKTGKAEERGDAVFLDATQLGIRKILGRGELRGKPKLIVRVNEISGIAKEKIEEAGGRIEMIEMPIEE
ncbi:MAG: 50S ribosomal protein L15 [Candidatus Methanophagaceae archaeon]|nr:MAG: 50S ribosomal protein L15 [Methanophagales archaeon]